jgi:hypothetical protein
VALDRRCLWATYRDKKVVRGDGTGAFFNEGRQELQTAQQAEMRAKRE